MEAGENTSGVAAQATLQLMGVPQADAGGGGVELELRKGLPLGGGLGSSAASAAAAAWAVNGLYGFPLSKAELVHAGLQAEAKVSGYHADNVGPSLTGGFNLIPSYDPLTIVPLEFKGPEPYMVVVNPRHEVRTADARAALPADVPLASLIAYASASALLSAAIGSGDAQMLGRAVNSDCVVEPARKGLIPGFDEVKAAALAAGATGCSISGAGPTMFAVVDDADGGLSLAEAVAREMQAAFKQFANLESTAFVMRLDSDGAQVIDTQLPDEPPEWLAQGMPELN